VLQASRIQRYCGSVDQWKDLQQRVGFRCRKDEKQLELCASAREWKRRDLTIATRRAIENHNINDEATASTVLNHPDRTFAPTVSAPVIAPTPAPAPAPAK
jgi:hypothetical protein